MNKKVLLYLVPVLAVLPAIAKAWTIESLACSVQGLIWMIFVVAAVVYFLWYGIMFLMARGDASGVQSARQGVLWGVVGVVVGAIALGVVSAILDFFNISANVFSC